MSSSSLVLREPPISDRWRDAHTGLTPEKEGEPLKAVICTAALVSARARATSSGSVMGRSFSARSFPSSVTA